ncbi:hypothetical protein LIER_08292 [Lithospermum erythrorhizon]|uniref:Uncharacterized protein n=1 Tax=Lithospermum erythrorhizon TaxID=34254 RepID=A0AAV3PG45_LITER
MSLFGSQTVNGTHVLARWCDHLARVNHSLGCQIRCAKKDISHKRGLIEGMGQEGTALKEELAKLSHLSEERAKEVVALTKELSSQKEDAKVWAVKKASLLAERDEASLDEEKADKPEWYDDLSLSDGDSSDEEVAEGVEACCSDKNLVINP